MYVIYMTQICSVIVAQKRQKRCFAPCPTVGVYRTPADSLDDSCFTAGHGSGMGGDGYAQHQFYSQIAVITLNSACRSQRSCSEVDWQRKKCNARARAAVDLVTLKHLTRHEIIIGFANYYQFNLPFYARVQQVRDALMVNIFMSQRHTIIIVVLLL